MYLRSLKLQNVKLIRDASLSFMRGDEVRRWTVLVGENGLCKTAILHAIALAASGRDRANQLHEDASSLRDIRLKGSEAPAIITAEFTFGRHRDSDRDYGTLERQSARSVLPILTSQLFVSDRNRLFAGSAEWIGRELTLSNGKDPLAYSRGIGLPHWFVAGYGVSRALPEPLGRFAFKDPVLDRLKPLFDRAPLIGTGFIDLFESTVLARQYVKTLRDILLTTDDLLPRISSVDLRGRAGVRKAEQLIESNRFSFKAGKTDVKVPATWLSQGYQATIAWIADLVGQIYWETGEAVPASELEGLVLIDELDLHLHPRWQVVLVKALKAALPNIQFVVTTHSPMILPGLEQDEIYRLALDDDGNVRIRQSDRPPTLMTATEIYDTFFGLDALYPNELGAALLRYGYLASDPWRSDSEEAELQGLRKQLNSAGLATEVVPEPRQEVAG
jgi:predicted ATPase